MGTTRISRAAVATLLALLVYAAGCGQEATEEARKGAGTGAAKTVGDPDVTRGRGLYEQSGCAICHGPEGRGDGQLAHTLSPRPRDLADTASYSQGTSVEAVAHTLGVGLLDKGKGMPGYSHLTDRERRSIAVYLISLGNRK